MAGSATWPRRARSTERPSWSWCAASAAPRPREEVPMAGELVLIVEDNEKNLKLVRDLLQFKGYRTLEAGTAEQGIGLAGEHGPDLILMDIQLPDMNGEAALGRLRAE